ncbi:hypothetical protein F4780DRAFT_784859 [Xylariomycetidae sp. FL0641]|nr:hypothetical protein F4780DRAFT_784859 [Xylariomycetidae sp. FL0641]
MDRRQPVPASLHLRGSSHNTFRSPLLPSAMSSSSTTMAGSKWPLPDEPSPMSPGSPMYLDDKTHLASAQVGEVPDAYAHLTANAPLPADTPRGGTARMKYVLGCWWFEIAATVVAVGAVVGMFVLPAYFEGEPVPEWLYGINITSIIAILSVIFKTALLMGVTEVLAQMKYVLFNKLRPLQQLQVLDEGTRGVYGALKLLVKPVHAVVSIAVLAIILSLACDPLVQQSVKTVPCPRILAGEKATVPVAHAVPGSSSYFRASAGAFELQYDMKGAMLSGVTDSLGNATTLAASCSTGNCTFEEHHGITYSSIGFCRKCIDTTPLIESIGFTASYPNYSLPNGQWISPTSMAPYMDVHVENSTGFAWIEAADASLLTDEMREVAPAAIANITFFTFTHSECAVNELGVTHDCKHNVTGWYSDTSYLALSCSLYACLKDYRGTVEQGMLDETVVSTTPAYPPEVTWLPSSLNKRSDSDLHVRDGGAVSLPGGLGRSGDLVAADSGDSSTDSSSDTSTNISSDASASTATAPVATSTADPESTSTSTDLPDGNGGAVTTCRTETAARSACLED